MQSAPEHLSLTKSWEDRLSRGRPLEVAAGSPKGAEVVRLERETPSSWRKLRQAWQVSSMRSKLS